MFTNFFCNDNIDALVVVVSDEWIDFVKENITKLNPPKPIYYAKPGETRQYSIYNAHNVVRERGFVEKSVVIIHDGAHPLVNDNLIIADCKELDAIIPVESV